MAVVNMSSVPVIDMQDFPGQLDKLIKACEERGCFRIVNFGHILPNSLMIEMKAISKSLFELPIDIKKRNVDNVIARSGYMAPSKINPYYESLGLYDMASPQDVDAFCSNLEVTPHQREIISKYAKVVNELMMDIGGKLGEGLGVNGTSFKDWACQLRINKYHFSAGTIGSPGVQLHSDSGFLTILQDDEEVGGLEVMNQNGTFQVVDPYPETLIVNIGDIATVWSNGRFVNVKHHVMCKEASERWSIASFLLAPKEEMVEVPEDLLDTEHPRLYVPFKYEDYRKLRVSQDLETGAMHRFMH